mmetsp:Transcript_19198/g.26415  ORF Transcript_19198/g.26415 Transcript_19198/m.26415 type:complete len:212 (-) Transcript_19198:105-740(-)
MSMPLTTSPIGLKPIPSKNSLSAVLIKICVVLVPGPAVAKVTVPRTFDVLTSSSSKFFIHRDCTDGSPLIPNCETKLGKTRKMRHPSQKFTVASSSKRSTPIGAQSGRVLTTKLPVVGRSSPSNIPTSNRINFPPPSSCDDGCCSSAVSTSWSNSDPSTISSASASASDSWSLLANVVVVVVRRRRRRSNRELKRRKRRVVVVVVATILIL